MIVTTGTSKDGYLGPAYSGGLSAFAVNGLPKFGLGNGVGRPHVAGAKFKGMGEDCPSFAPFKNVYGGCTNVNPSTPSPTGSSVNGSVIPYNDPGSAFYQRPEYLPAGWVANPWTGVAQQQAIANDFGAAESSRADADAEGRAAMAAGAARGVNVICRTVQNDSTPGFPGLYWSSCSVAGSVEQYDAGSLAAAGGIESALMSEGRAAGTLFSSVPFLRTVGPVYIPTPEPIPAQLIPAPAPATRPAQAPPRIDQTTSMPSGTQSGNVSKAMANAAGGVLERVEEATGIGTTGLLIVGGIALFLFLKR